MSQEDSINWQQAQYFGEPGDAPAWEYGIQAPTPVGQPCRHCQEAIVDGDRGWLHPHLDNRGDGVLTVVGQTPIHVECFLAEILGHDNSRESAQLVWQRSQEMTDE
jgi:hypothetical protein